MSSLAKAAYRGNKLAKTSLLSADTAQWSSPGNASTAWPDLWKPPQLPETEGRSGLPVPDTTPVNSSSQADVQRYVPGELIVTFSAQSDTAARGAGMAKAIAAVGGTLKDLLITSLPSQAADHPLVARIAVGEGMALEKAADVLARLPGVQSVDFNWHLSIQTLSKDPSYLSGEQWGMYGDDPLVGPVDNAFGSQADEAWAAGHTGSTKVVVGVVDTGIDYRHPDLYLNIWLNQGEIANLPFRTLLEDADGDGLITFCDLNSAQNKSNTGLSAFLRDLNGNGYIDAGDLLDNASGWEDGVDNDADGYVDDLIGWDFANNDNDPLDDNGHGTHVAGIMGADGGNGSMVAGVSWHTQMVAIKAFNADGAAETAGVTNGVNYYANVSATATSAQHFVATNNSWGFSPASAVLFDAIVRTAREGALFVAAAGNGGADLMGDNIDFAPYYPSSFSTREALGYEAIISVAALDAMGRLANYSNVGRDTVDLAAPGSDILSTYTSGTVNYLSGTSMAAPFVTGALALYAAEFSDLSSQQWRAALLTSSAATTSLQGMTATGGRLDVSTLMNTVINGSDILAPKVSITLDDYALSGSEVARVTFQFNELVRGFDISDVLMGAAAGSLSAFTEVNPGLAYTALFTPFTSTTDTSNTIGVRGEGYWDTNYNLGESALSANFEVASAAVRFYVGTSRNDSLTGSPLGDKLSGVPLSDRSLGKGTVDQLIGKAGADLFVIGDARGNFYDDGSTRTTGTKDYALVNDFNMAEGDRIQVKAGNYLFLPGTFNRLAGTSVYSDTKTLGVLETSDELIGFLIGVSPAQMSNENLLFV
mgnify:CR=1 FL=1